MVWDTSEQFPSQQRLLFCYRVDDIDGIPSVKSQWYRQGASQERWNVGRSHSDRFTLSLSARETFHWATSLTGICQILIYYSLKLLAVSREELVSLTSTFIFRSSASLQCPFICEKSRWLLNYRQDGEESSREPEQQQIILCQEVESFLLPHQLFFAFPFFGFFRVLLSALYNHYFSHSIFHSHSIGHTSTSAPPAHNRNCHNVVLCRKLLHTIQHSSTAVKRAKWNKKRECGWKNIDWQIQLIFSPPTRCPQHNMLIYSIYFM